MNILIVYAHPEPAGSFNATMRDAAVRALEAAGHTVVVSDLYRAGFAATLDRHDFLEAAEPARFDAPKEQSHAFRSGTFAPQVKAEMDKLDACDLMVWQFPIYWFSVPAVLKGWIDRVFAYRYAYGGARWYEKGAFAGKKAMIAMTTGAPRSSFVDGSRNGDMNMMLWPLLWGTLRFVGFDVLPPFVAYGVATPGAEGDARRAKVVEDYTALLANIEAVKPLTMNLTTDFAADGSLIPGHVSRHPGPPDVS